jgi:hypothetical protein
MSIEPSADTAIERIARGAAADHPCQSAERHAWFMLVGLSLLVVLVTELALPTLGQQRAGRSESIERDAHLAMAVTW